MSLLPPSVVKAAKVVALFSVIGTGLVALVHKGTENRISANQRQTLLHTLQALVPAEAYDNDLLADGIEVDAKELGSARDVSIYRARKGNQPVAVVFAPGAPDGYSGEIRMLVAVKADGTLAGVRVIGHKETPGLGDPIEENKSDWILRFAGLSLNNPPAAQWKVKRDGGAFDQFTGATITPRAVVKQVRRTLDYFAAHQAELYTQAPQTDVDSPVDEDE
ncbi:electron transport complex subunit RsxG [Methylococcus sp. EFPC2]|uniref:electron transport complex subunit RsxG n=1 Tax=Methylococcus sp. EFPC2 TaxID=2812648 RepID=UPI001968552B|nr:electron transport complex subunit RsxG [Methylococcus sp. EFPC2]QSA96902.1 electron transport complex subunit RsxG [Methylococcus sp. EFPC2]